MMAAHSILYQSQAATKVASYLRYVWTWQTFH